MTCETCKFARSRTPKMTLEEQWEADPRPTNSTASFWQRCWDPSKYKENTWYDSDPEYKNWDVRINNAIINDNANIIWCTLNPQPVMTRRKYECGSYEYMGTRSSLQDRKDI